MNWSWVQNGEQLWLTNKHVFFRSLWLHSSAKVLCVHTTQAQKQKPQDKHYINNTFLSVLYLEIQFSWICCLFSGQIIHQRKACFHVTLSASVMCNLKSITVICRVRNRTNPKGLQFLIRKNSWDTLKTSSDLLKKGS